MDGPGDRNLGSRKGEMMNLFSDDRYDEVIDQTYEQLSTDTSADASAIARVIMVAGCCIAQAIDNLSSGKVKYGGSIRDSLDEVSVSIEGVTEAIKEGQ